MKMCSANIPFEIQAEIIKRVLPVKSLIRFRSVSKQWKSLIGSSQFIADHSVNQTHPHHLLVSYFSDSTYEYLSIVDDDCFPNHKFSPNVSPIIKLITNIQLVGSSHGLVCLCGDVKKGMSMFVVWNPSIRKSVGIMFPLTTFKVSGFGVCPKTGDPKIVKITGTSITSKDWNVEVYRLSSRSWRTVSINLPHKPRIFKSKQVVKDGVIYWVAYDFIENDAGYPHHHHHHDDYHLLHHQIISFDLTTEEFGELELPERIASCEDVYIHKLKEGLVVLSCCTCDADKQDCDAWLMLKNGVSNFLFTKLFKVNVKAYFVIIELRKNGQPIIRTLQIGGSGHKQALKVYDPRLESISDLGIYGSAFSLTSYTESLLLLNHSHSILE